MAGSVAIPPACRRRLDAGLGAHPCQERQSHPQVALSFDIRRPTPSGICRDGSLQVLPVSAKAFCTTALSPVAATRRGWRRRC